MIIIDSHVHIYNCFNLEAFFNAAYSNFQAEAARSGSENDFTAILLLTETANENWFDRFSQYRTGTSLDLRQRLGSWEIELTADDTALRAINNQNKILYLLAGRQIKTKENLEVLALGTTRSFMDYESLDAVFQSVLLEKGLIVLPWSPGKWFGNRGRIINQMIQEADPADLFLGDIFGRPHLWPTPKKFNTATEKGIRILAGTDPLPFPSEHAIPGSFGCTLTGPLDEENLSDSLKKLLISRNTRFRIYGDRVGVHCFIKNQVLLRRRNLENSVIN